MLSDIFKKFQNIMMKVKLNKMLTLIRSVIPELGLYPIIKIFYDETLGS